MIDTIAYNDFQPRVIAPCPVPERIQYACGVNVLPQPWLNVDFFDDALIWRLQQTGVPKDVAEQVLKVDLLAEHPFPSGHFSYAFAEDFIEHLTQAQAILFLTEVKRTLRPGGVFRVSAPSLPGVVAQHFANADRAHAEREIIEAYTRWGHQHFFSHDSLQTITEGLGFSGYRRCSYGVSTHPELAGLETRADQAELNLYAEVIR